MEVFLVPVENFEKADARSDVFSSFSFLILSFFIGLAGCLAMHGHCNTKITKITNKCQILFYIGLQTDRTQHGET